MLALDLGECKPGTRAQRASVRPGEIGKTEAAGPPPYGCPTGSALVRHAEAMTTDAAGPIPPTSVPPTARAGRRRWPWLIGAVAFVVACASIAVLLTSGGGKASPGSTADGYYRALAKDDAPTAYRLLCQRQRQLSTSSYATEVRQIRASGTGISSWTRTSSQQRDEVAVVTGHLTLANGEGTDIQVLEVRESGSWRVCGSNLGGVLPPVGQGSTGGGSGTVPT